MPLALHTIRSPTLPLTLALALALTLTSQASVDSMSFAQLRDALIALAPLDKQHIVEVNRAEAEFWKRSEGYRVDWSDKVLKLAELWPRSC